MKRLTKLGTPKEANYKTFQNIDENPSKEITSAETRDLHFESIHNFRKIPGTKLYRSAKLDQISKPDFDKFMTLGIKRIVDLRVTHSSSTFKENVSFSAEKFLDDVYEPYILRYNDATPLELTFYGFTENGAISMEGAVTSISGVPKAHIHFEMMHGLMNLTSLKRELSIPLQMVLWFCSLLDKLCNSHLEANLLGWKIEKEGGVQHFYKDIIDNYGDYLCSVLRLLSESSNVPALICCSFGKDRTGIIAALLESVVGMSNHAIACDYEASLNVVNTLIQKKEYAEFANMLKNMKLDSFCGANYSTMADLLDYIDQKYGSVSRYLTKHGFDETQQEQLRLNISRSG